MDQATVPAWVRIADRFAAYHAQKPATAAADGSEHHDGAMIALQLDPSVAGQVAVEGGLPPEEMHITLLYLGKAEDVDAAAVSAALESFQPPEPGPLVGTIGGALQFDAEDEVPHCCAVDVPGLAEFHTHLIEHLAAAGIESASEHGWTAHVTRIYLPKGEAGPEPLANIPVAFDAVHLVHGTDVTAFPLATPVASWASEVEGFLSRLAHRPGGHEHDQTNHGGGGAGMNRHLRSDGGVTVRPGARAGVPVLVRQGIPVGISEHSQIIEPGAYKPQLMVDYMAEKASVVAAAPPGARGYGAWHDADTGRVWLDVVDIFPESRRNEAVAEGRRRGEKSVYSIGHKELIDTGGTGNETNIVTSSSSVEPARGGDPGVGLAPGPARSSEADGRGPGSALRLAGAGFDPSDISSLLGRITHHPGGRDHPQKDHGGGGGGGPAHDIPTSGAGAPWDELSPLAQQAQTDWMANNVVDGVTGKAMTADQVRARIKENLGAHYDRSTEEQRDWYLAEHEQIQNVADATGVPAERVAGVMSVTSAHRDALENRAVTEDILTTFNGADTVTYTQKNIDEYNNFFTEIRDNGKPRRHDVGLEPHTDMKPGTYLVKGKDPNRPDMEVSPPDILMSKHGIGADFSTGQAGLLPFAKAGAILQGKPMDDAIGGAKQRSFVNNLSNPDTSLDVTHDTWDYRVSFQGMKIKKDVGLREMGPDGKWVPILGADGKAVKVSGAFTVEELEAYKVPGAFKSQGHGGPYGHTSPQDLFQGTGKMRKSGAYKGTVDDGLYPLLTKLTADVAVTRGRVLPSRIQAGVWGLYKAENPA